MSLMSATSTALDEAGTAEAALGQQAPTHSAEALFQEARRRGHRRRAYYAAISITVLGAAVGAYAALRAGQSPSTPAALLARPLHLPALSAGQSCPATHGDPIATSFFNGVAFGGGPVRVMIANEGDLRRGDVDLGGTGAPGWSALQTLWFSAPGYQGPFVVRGRRLGASGVIEVRPGSTGLVPGSGPLIVPAGATANTQDGYRTVPGSTWARSPGCYAWQVDGRDFSEVIVVDAVGL
jgi:hypothetical protein